MPGSPGRPPHCTPRPSSPSTWSPRSRWSPPDFKRRILAAFTEGAGQRPQTTFGTVKADVLERFVPGFRRQNLVETIENSSWPECARPMSPDEPGTVVVTDAGTGRYTQKITTATHELLADEAADVGGDDAGPNPYELLLSALGTCTAMTLRMYADRKGIPLTGTTVRLRHDRIHAKDCAECETGTGMLSRIRREIRLDGELDADQRARLMEIADRCPVHRTLTAEIVIETSEA
ncbi:OsmC family protein [Amycolatopsis sp. H20-H5]|uniref:OsmC family protein n=1 Tax=Amycolatopsis sp. H20-H5 TaxID=3046309 RepID=UPI002DB9F38F|nr:OsmC family protein [Amycolatopsis sp. H20-H5]MEC3974149.1 OsmC family protein [Amycolatopsis sp. H20-H5]